MNNEIRILILEDIAADAELIERELRASGMKFTSQRVDSRESFAKALADYSPDVVLSDYNLPQFSGLDALRSLRGNGSTIPFILVTGSLTEEIAVLCMKEGADDYVLKDSLKRLPSAVAKTLEQQMIEKERQQALAAMRQSEERFRLVARATNDVIWDWDIATDAVWWNEGIQNLFGYSKEAVGANHSWWYECIHPDDRNRVAAGLHVFIETHAQFWSDEYRFRRADDTYAVVIDRGFILRDDHNEAIRMIGSMMDVTERKKAEEQIQYLSYYDPLTGLPNRALYENRVPQALSLAQRNQQTAAVILLNIDRFKNINDTLGHHVGDLLVRSVAERLTSRMRGSDIVARFSDGFALLITQMSRSADIPKVAGQAKDDAVEIVESILTGFSSPFEIGGQDLFVTASAGISVYPHDGQDAHALLQTAGIALGRVQDQGGNGYQFYCPEMNATAVRALTLENDLRRAIERDEFVLHYQPQVDAVTGEILAVEALIRWVHPTLGFVAPGEFIPLAESNGFIVPIGEWTLRTACAQLRSWKAEGFDNLRMSVNLSARQFEQANLLPMVAGVMADNGFDPHCLEFEITESAVMKNAERAISLMRRLKEMQIQIAIDDFGSGYSSLSYLKRFPINRLKIDQSFVREAVGSATDAAIIMAIITLARNLGLRVIAEGVETPEQLAMLRNLGCDEIQGFLISKPMPAESLQELLVRRCTASLTAPSLFRISGRDMGHQQILGSGRISHVRLD